SAYFPVSEKGATTPVRAFPPPSLPVVELLPARAYNLQIASNLWLSFLPDLPKTGNHQKGEPNSDIPEKNSTAHDENLAVLRKFGGALRCVEASAREQC